MEIDGEPIEEFGVGGGFAGDAEIAGSFNDASAEEFLSEAVDGDAARERVFGADEPLGEAEAIVGRAWGQGREGGRGIGGDAIFALIILAAI